jgi:hypothetical protein
MVVLDATKYSSESLTQVLDCRAFLYNTWANLFLEQQKWQTPIRGESADN